MKGVASELISHDSTDLNCSVPDGTYGNPCLKARQRRVQRVARERVGVFVGREPVAEAHDCGPVNRGQENAEDPVGRRPRRKIAGGNRVLDELGHVLLHLADEPEALPVAADARHGAVDEHQGEVLGMRLAELVDAPESRADRFDPAARFAWLAARREEHPEALFGERQEDVVLAREIAVDRGRTVFDLLGDLSNRNVRVPLFDEKVPSGIENGARDRLPVAFLSFLDSHLPSRPQCLNTIEQRLEG